ncbi:MAG: haloacid dehalogenase-like hydrolase [Nitrososphaerota archaeon]|jgi:dolichol kinase/phosphoserine phosphatase|nr:haloacid dehalogenase-like hydrolase [Nitrososphaerota archaeon]
MSLSEKPRLIVFDVEGVLIPKNRFIFEVGKTLGAQVFFKFVFWGLLYEIGFITLESAFRHIFGELKDVNSDVLTEAFNKIPTPPYLQNLFSQLKARNCKIALISSGVPSVLVKKLGALVGADYAYGVEIEQKNGKLTGVIWSDAIAKNAKLKILHEILNRENLLISDCIVVADDRNNRCIFLSGMLKIGFNPDFVIRIKADRVVNGNLPGILPLIAGKPHKRHFPSVNDFVRENIHAAGFFVPVLASMLGTFAVVSSIIVIAIIYVISELARLEGYMVPLVSSITRRAASQSELHGFATAPLYFAFGIVATILLFPSPISGAAVAMFCLGDSAASLFGGLLSTSLPFNKGKTLEGSLAGFVFAFLGGTFFVPPLLALAGAAIAMTIEALPLPFNDNVLVPLITGAALTLLIAAV